MAFRYAYTRVKELKDGLQGVASFNKDALTKFDKRNYLTHLRQVISFLRDEYGRLSVEYIEEIKPIYEKLKGG